MPKIKINGKDIEVQEGTKILEACLKNNIPVPYYCYHPGLSIAGNCRMCLVKVSTSKKLEASCAFPCSEGMAIETECQEVQAARKSVLEFMLVNHPIDCPICDKAGECLLQDYTYQYREGLSRVKKEDKVIRDTKDLGPTIKIWGNRCISCTRCVRFCEEISGSAQLTIVNRGDHSVADVAPTVELDDPLSLNTVDICPVGALISKDFLYQSRVWYTAATESICPSCSQGCNIKVTVLNNEVKRLEPRLNADVNQYWMCDEGRLNYKYISSPKRLRTGKGTARDFVREARSRIQKYGKTSFLGVASTYNTNEELYLFKKTMNALGIENISIFRHTRGEKRVFKNGFTIEADGSPNTRGAEIVFGKGSEPESSDFKGIFVMNGIPNITEIPEWLKKTIAMCEYVALMDIMQNQLTEWAHALFPGAAFVEKEGTFVNRDGRIQRIRKCLDASYPVQAEIEEGKSGLLTKQGTKELSSPKGARPEIEILQEILIELKVRERIISAEGIFKEMSSEIDVFRGLDYGKVETQGIMIETQTNI